MKRNIFIVLLLFVVKVYLRYHHKTVSIAHNTNDFFNYWILLLKNNFTKIPRKISLYYLVVE